MVSREPIRLPRIVISAAASGHGKTTIATGILAALAARGLQVSPHKVGPDYIDPGYHALAAGRPGRNLDPWLVGEDRIPGLLLHGALTPQPADVAVIEGVMGLHDGAVGWGGFASTAHVAILTQSPVVVVLDVTGQGRSAAALVQGLADFDPRVRIGGVILNRVGSPRHTSLLRDAMNEIDLPVLGAIPRRDEVAAPSRHLGLIPVAERASESLEVVAALGDLVTSTCDLDALLALAGTAPALTEAPWDPAVELAAAGVATGGAAAAGSGWGNQADRPVIAVAGGAAFTFSYRENLELLEAAGAQVVVFDPLSDPELPPGTVGLVIGGGFPEMHAQALAANRSLLAQIAAFTGPVHAECAGLLYLATALDGVPMAGTLPAQAAMSPSLTLGYREAVAVSDSVLARAGDVVRGHEFHRTMTTPAAGADPAWQWNGEVQGFVQNNIHASYLHTHAAGQPHTAARFVQACRQSAAVTS